MMAYFKAVGKVISDCGLQRNGGKWLIGEWFSEWIS